MRSMDHRKLIMKLFRLILVVAFAAPIMTINAASSDANITLLSPMLQGTEPITRYDAIYGMIATLDPQKAETLSSITPIENLFLGLTDIDPKTGEPRPEAATNWTKNAAGDVWVFTLRNDIPWVRWNPQTKKAVELRKVTAADFEYGIKRACDPRLEAYYTHVAAAMIKNCDVVAGLSPKTIKDSDFDQIGVRILSDTQLEITTQGPLSFFLSASGMWMFRAVPKEMIAEYGNRWTDPGFIVTNGPFVLDQWSRGTRLTYLRNPLYPKGINDEYGGNIERINTIVVSDADTMYSLYRQNLLDVTFIPHSEYERAAQDPALSKQIVQLNAPATWYFGFMYDKPPFDKVGVRRAFNAILDRKAFVKDVLQGRGIPTAHFMPPGIPGAVPNNEVGLGKADNLGFDPDYAKQQFAEAGYADCKNFPAITVMSYSLSWVRFLRNAAKTYLNCDPALIRADLVDFDELSRLIKPQSAFRPNMFVYGWIADYPDAHNWMHDVLSCNAENAFKRPCDTAIDGKINVAANETDPQKRKQLYRELEEAFFGQNGEFPIAPLFNELTSFMVKPWYTGAFVTDGQFGGEHWNTYVIDPNAQRDARRNGI